LNSRTLHEILPLAVRPRRAQPQNPHRQVVGTGKVGTSRINRVVPNCKQKALRFTRPWRCCRSPDWPAAQRKSRPPMWHGLLTVPRSGDPGTTVNCRPSNLNTYYGLSSIAARGKFPKRESRGKKSMCRTAAYPSRVAPCRHGAPDGWKSRLRELATHRLPTAPRALRSARCRAHPCPGEYTAPGTAADRCRSRNGRVPPP